MDSDPTNSSPQSQQTTALVTKVVNDLVELWGIEQLVPKSQNFSAGFAGGPVSGASLSRPLSGLSSDYVVPRRVYDRLPKPKKSDLLPPSDPTTVQFSILPLPRGSVEVRFLLDTIASTTTRVS